MGVRKSVFEVLKDRFKRIPKSLKDTISSIDEESLLSKLHREAIVIDSLEAFEKIADYMRESAPKKTVLTH